MYTVLRRIWIESMTVLLFLFEFGTNILRFAGMGRRYYQRTNRIDGRLVVVTGANSGIGKETVFQLSSRGAKVSFVHHILIGDEYLKQSFISSDYYGL